jgi:hypothetical protein
MVKYLYGDEEVSIVRDAKPEGQEGSANEPEQVVVELEDGTEKTVNRSELRQK